LSQTGQMTSSEVFGPADYPPNIQAMSAFQPEGSLDSAARGADRISEIAPQPVLVSVGPPPDSATLLQGIRGPHPPGGSTHS
jgi:hypothetical protein